MIASLFSRNRKTLGEVLAPQHHESAGAFVWLSQAASELAPARLRQPSLAEWLAPEAKPAPVKKTSLRDKQLEEVLTEDEKRQQRAAAKKRDRRLAIALSSLGMATLGQVVFWPLKLLSLGCSVYLTAHFYQKAYRMLRKGKVGVPTLMVVSMAGALVCGYIWLASFFLVLAQFAQRLTAKVTADSRAGLVDVFRQVPKTAWVLVDGVEIRTPLADVKAGQTVAVGGGEAIPVDGTVAAGMAAVDQHLLTGEARPVDKGAGDPVFAGTLVLSGRLEITVEKAGGDTAAARIVQILNATTEYKSTAQLRAEHLAQRTVAPTLAAGALALPILGPMGALAVVDSHFRQRMSILAPLALMNYLNIASHHGILIKDGRSLDLLGQVDTLVFDKTGTLTEEQPGAGAIHVCAGYGEDQVLRYAAAAEQKQSHPIAHAILAEAKRRGLDIPVPEEADYTLGYGLSASVEGCEVRVGSRRFMESLALQIPPGLEAVFAASHRQGHSLVLVACDGAVAGAIELAPTVRPEARRVIQALRERNGIKATYIISGDHEAPTAKLARELGIDHYFAEVLPEQKAELIERLTGEGRFVCYVGDGINDAIALKKSHVSISLRGASSVAVDTAQIVLMDGDLRHLPQLFEFARGFKANTDRAFAICVVPTLISIGGAFFLHFTILHTGLIGMASILAGLGNAMQPLLRHRHGLQQAGEGATALGKTATAGQISHSAHLDAT